MVRFGLADFEDDDDYDDSGDRTSSRRSRRQRYDGEEPSYPTPTTLTPLTRTTMMAPSFSSPSPAGVSGRLSFGSGGAESLTAAASRPSTSLQQLPHHQQHRRPTRRASTQSCRLACWGPAQKLYYAVTGDKAQHYLDIHTYLHDDSTSFDPDRAIPVTRLTLPRAVQERLQLDDGSVLELLCLDNDEPVLSPSTPATRRQTPRLCICTASSLFVLQASYNTSNLSSPRTSSRIPGNVLQLPAHEVDWITREPLQRVLLDQQCRLIRVRRPTSHHLCPSASFAVLLYMTEWNEYQLVLHHHDGSLTVPLTFAVEDLADDSQYHDFCFAASSGGLSLLTSLSVLLLRGNGDVASAGPVLFARTLVPRTQVRDVLDYVGHLVNTMERDSALWRQARMAQQYCLDTFPLAAGVGGGKNAASSRLVQASSDAFDRYQHWTVQLQTVLFATTHDEREDDHAPPVTSMECFGNGSLCSVALGRADGSVDVGLISPTAMVPRFTHATRDDQHDLDDGLDGLAWIVEHVTLGWTTQTTQGNVRLLPDPIVDTLLHIFTPAAVATIATNIVRLKSAQITGQGSTNERHESSAWSVVAVGGNGATVTGGMVGANTEHGHNLLVVMSDGTGLVANVTDAQCLQAQLLSDDASDSLHSRWQQQSERAIQAIDQAPSLHRIVEPIIKRLQSGLDSMTMIVGSETPSSEVTPDALATVAAIKERCDQQVVLPLTELHKLLHTYKRTLADTTKRQVQQLQSLRDTIAELQERTGAIADKVKQAEANGQTLLERARLAMYTCRDLQPTISRAEYDYFTEMQRLALHCDDWETETEQLVERVNDLTRATRPASFAALTRHCHDNPDLLKKADALLMGQEVSLLQAGSSLEEMQARTDRAAKEAGFETENVSENIISTV